MPRRVAISTTRAIVSGIVCPATIVIEAGLITDILERDAPLPEDVDVHDAGDAVVMAGLIDAHVHINEPGRTDWEGFETATKAAAAGGITTVVDMPLNSSPVTTSLANFHEKLAAAQGKLWVDCAFYAGLVPGNAHAIEALLDAGVVGVKAFLCHSGIDDFPNATEADLRAVMPLLARRDVPLLVHAELVDDVQPPNSTPTSYRAYMESRPQRWELQAIKLLIDLCREYRAPVHIVHLAASNALPMLAAARAEGLPISVETGPHYLYFAAEDIPDADTRYKCAPPIRDAQNRDALWRGLLDGVIDLVGTDHSPCPPDLKALETGDLMAAWGGISSLQLLLPVLWTAARERGASLIDIARWTSHEPACLLGLQDRLGDIAPGREANLVVWNPDEAFEVDASILYHRHKITPYDGQTLHGVVEATYLRGQKIFDRHKLTATASGRCVIPSPVTLGETS